MCPRDDTSVVALADDLSGAAEVAALLRLPARLTLHAADLAVPATAGESVVVDLDSRYLDEAAAATAVRTALAGAGAASRTRPAGTGAAPGAPRAADAQEARSRAFRAVNSRAGHGRTLPALRTLWYKKCDSLLRGPVGAEAVAFAEGAELVVIATALPAAGRVVRDGVVLVDGVPLHESAAWRAERRAAPRSVAEALAPLPTEVVPAGAVRQGPLALAGLFREAAARGRHPACDAETDADLAVIAAAAALLGPGCRLLGSGGLAAALGRRITSRTPDAAPAPAPTPTAGLCEQADAGPVSRPLLVVAGSAEPVVAEQVARLVAAGARHLRLLPPELAGPAPVVLPEPPPGTVTVLSVDGSGGVRPDAARRIAAGLARTVAALPGRPDLVLTGGETARRVLDAVGVTTLWPVGEIHHGAVHCKAPDGRSVVTRPGSFGGPDSFHRIAAALRPRLLSTPSPPPLSPPSPRSPAPSAAAPSQQGVTQ
ncbi:four-carbon acid sugar kinase family protein [Streptomyces sp. NPDC057433]|uniref:four-carbon acid sugar kinase family protein n=1 Tax=Streptomyces sp. NPDC057433 TaxID=3346132 RepID=UPI0036ADAED7